jgi:hypothetical protein
MKLTGEDRNTRGKTCPSVTLPTTNPTCTDPGSNTGLGAGRPAANRVSHGTTLIISYTKENIVYEYFFPILIFVINHLKTEITLNYISQAKFVPRSKHTVSVLKINQLMLHSKIIVLCSEVCAKHVNKAELYYRLTSYRAANTPR